MLITGAAGFIGGYTVAECLRLGHHVTAVTRSRAPADWAGAAQLDVIRADLRDPGSLDLKNRGIDVVVHLAAALSGDAATQLRDTITSTSHLLAATRAAGIRKLVCISSLAVLDYESLAPGAMVDEAVLPVPLSGSLSAYAAAKRDQEELCRQFGVQDANCCLILRPGLVYDESHLISAHAGIIKAGLGLIVLHEGEIPTVEVRGVARAIVGAAERLMPGSEVVNLVDDQLPTQTEYLRGLQLRGQLPKLRIAVPWRLAVGALRLLGLALAVIPGRSVPEIAFRHTLTARLTPLRFDNAKAKHLLGWTPGNRFQ